MGKINQPRKGSLAIRPRKRAKRQMPSVGSWPVKNEKGILGFAGYKAGMTHVTYVDESPGPTNGSMVSTAVTVLETPPLLVYGIRGYKKGNAVGDIISDDEKILRPISLKKKKKNEFKLEDVDEIFILAYTQPKNTGMGKKKPERMEICISGADLSEKLAYAQELLGKELKASDVFQEGEFVDSVSVSKGKGWQGTVKRLGTRTQRPKATGRVRHVGCLGPWHPAITPYTAPMAGQTGYHRRTEISKMVMLLGTGTDITPKGGFPKYGEVKSDFIVIKGSVPGPRKRLVRLRKAMRAKAEPKKPEIKHISVESKQ